MAVCRDEALLLQMALNALEVEVLGTESVFEGVVRRDLVLLHVGLGGEGGTVFRETDVRFLVDVLGRSDVVGTFLSGGGQRDVVLESFISH